MAVSLVTTHHDPRGRIYDQMARMLPRLRELYTPLAVIITASTEPRTRELLRQNGAHIGESDRAREDALRYVGLHRRQALELALNTDPAVTHIHLCDFDRVLHWVEFHPDELRMILARLSAHDFTVLGRTPRAFASHPRVQRDTEAIINHAFNLASGKAWDVSAASRGLSRRAAEAIVASCHDDTIGNDCSWPLYLQRLNGLTLSYMEAEGLEFETLDRHADEVTALGSREAWIERIESDPQQWAHRLELAFVEVESIVAYSSNGSMDE